MKKNRPERPDLFSSCNLSLNVGLHLFLKHYMPVEHGTLGVQTHETWVEASSLTTKALGSLLGLFGPKFFLFSPFSLKLQATFSFLCCLLASPLLKSSLCLKVGSL